MPLGIFQSPISLGNAGEVTLHSHSHILKIKKMKMKKKPISHHRMLLSATMKLRCGAEAAIRTLETWMTSVITIILRVRTVAESLAMKALATPYLKRQTTEHIERKFIIPILGPLPDIQRRVQSTTSIITKQRATKLLGPRVRVGTERGPIPRKRPRTRRGPKLVSRSVGRFLGMPPA